MPDTGPISDPDSVTASVPAPYSDIKDPVFKIIFSPITLTQPDREKRVQFLESPIREPPADLKELFLT